MSNVPVVLDVLGDIDEDTEEYWPVRTVDPAHHRLVLNTPVPYPCKNVRIVYDTSVLDASTMTNIVNDHVAHGQASIPVYIKMQHEEILEHEKVVGTLDKIAIMHFWVARKSTKRAATETTDPEPSSEPVDDGSSSTHVVETAKTHPPMLKDATAAKGRKAFAKNEPPLHLEVKDRGILKDSSVSLVLKTIFKDTEQLYCSPDVGNKWTLTVSRLQKDTLRRAMDDGTSLAYPLEPYTQISNSLTILNVLKDEFDCDIREILRTEGPTRFPNLFLLGGNSDYLDDKHFLSEVDEEEGTTAMQSTPARSNKSKKQKTLDASSVAVVKPHYDDTTLDPAI